MKFIRPENSKLKCNILIKCQRKNIRITVLKRRLSSYAYCLLFQRIQVLTPVPWYLTPSHKRTYKQNSNAHKSNFKTTQSWSGDACLQRQEYYYTGGSLPHLLCKFQASQLCHFVKTTLKKLNRIVVFFIVSYMKLEMWLNGRVRVQHVECSIQSQHSKKKQTKILYFGAVQHRTALNSNPLPPAWWDHRYVPPALERYGSLKLSLRPQYMLDILPMLLYPAHNS